MGVGIGPNEFAPWRQASLVTLGRKVKVKDRWPENPILEGTGSTESLVRVVNTAAPGPAHEGTLGVSSPGGGEAFCGTFAATGSGVVFVMGKER